MSKGRAAGRREPRQRSPYRVSLPLSPRGPVLQRPPLPFHSGTACPSLEEPCFPGAGRLSQAGFLRPGLRPPSTTAGHWSLFRLHLPPDARFLWVLVGV